jgi:hypothetical protein
MKWLRIETVGTYSEHFNKASGSVNVGECLA